MKNCIVVNPQGTDPIMEGVEEEVVNWLVLNPSDQPRYVYISATADILTESEFLDLA